MRWQLVTPIAYLRARRVTHLVTMAAQRVCVIGSGVAGLSCASELSARSRGDISVTLLERGAHIGGHAHTKSVPLTELDGPAAARRASVDIDCGFMVFNRVTYPNMLQWFARHGVEVENTDMSFSVDVEGAGLLGSGGLQWASNTLGGLFAQKTNAVNPRFYRMLLEVRRCVRARRRRSLPSRPAWIVTSSRFRARRRADGGGGARAVFRPRYTSS
jgi:predicted NAD/FAD-binding protein